MMKITETVKQLIIINVLFFIGTYFVGMEPAYDILALHAPQNEHFKIWQLVTHMFMHGGIQHILFNMLGLWMFGSPLEHFWGTKRFLFFYFSCGLGAAALHLGVSYIQLQYILDGARELNLSQNTLHQILNVNITDGAFYSGEVFKQNVFPILQNAGKMEVLNAHPEALQSLFDATVSVHAPMLGASGAIYGIIVAFAFMFPNAELMLLFLPIPIKAKYFVPGLVAIDLFLGLKGQSLFGSHFEDGVAHFAHLGGALIGFLMMWYWSKNKFNHNRWN